MYFYLVIRLQLSYISIIQKGPILMVRIRAPNSLNSTEIQRRVGRIVRFIIEPKGIGWSINKAMKKGRNIREGNSNDHCGELCRIKMTSLKKMVWLMAFSNIWEVGSSCRGSSLNAYEQQLKFRTALCWFQDIDPFLNTLAFYKLSRCIGIITRVLMNISNIN